MIENLKLQVLNLVINPTLGGNEGDDIRAIKEYCDYGRV